MKSILCLIGFLLMISSNQDITAQQKIQKDEMTAMIFSAFTPGLGQVYTQRYWRGLGFFILEVAAFGTMSGITERTKKIRIYDTEGDEYKIIVQKNRWKNLKGGEKAAVITAGVAGAGIYIWQIFDARKCVKEHNRKQGYDVGLGLTPSGAPGLSIAYQF